VTEDSRGMAKVITRSEWGPELPVLEGLGRCQEIVGPGSGASLRSLFFFELQPLCSTVALRHAEEAVYFVIAGEIQVAHFGRHVQTVGAGGMIHVRPHQTYQISTMVGARFLGGPSPVDERFGMAEHLDDEGEWREDGVRIFSKDEPGLLVPMISRDARLIVWFGADAVTANMNYVVLEPGERNKEHLHRYSEDTIYILEGRGTAEDVTNGVKLPFQAGDTVTIPPGVIHAVAADQGERVISVGGPCPADLDMLRAAGVDVDALSLALGYV
jgi:quercetin dioxygenase-like cupin family protein